MIFTSNRILISCSALSLLFALAGCGPKYRPKRLEHLNKKTADYHESKNNVTVYAKAFKPVDYEYYFTNERYIFGGEVVKKMERKFQAVEVTVNNSSSNTITVDPQAIDLPYKDLKEVYRKVRFSSVPPMLFDAALGAGWSMLFSLAVFHKLVPAFIIPMILIDGFIGTFVVSGPNKHLKKDLTEKMLHSKQAIFPDELKSFLIFVEKQQYVPVFNLEIEKDSELFADFEVSLSSEMK